MKNFNLDDVKDVAERLMTNFDKTTTLEIKMELRQKGFIANQVEVSNAVMELSDEYGWRWTNKVHTNGSVYRVYSLPDGYVPNYVMNDNNDSHIDNEDEQNNIDDPTNDFADCYIDKYGCLIKVQQLEDVNIGDWIVYSSNNTSALYFSGKYTRDNVRCAYAGLMKIPFVNTRSKRYK